MGTMTYPAVIKLRTPGPSGCHAGKCALRLAGLALVLVLGACGGGGGGGSDAPPAMEPPPPPTTRCIQTVGEGCLDLVEYEREVGGRMTAYTNQRNFSNQWGLSRIRAQRAYAHVELLAGTPIDPGEGVTLGFVDSGIDRSHELFAGATINEVFLLGATSETGTRFSHGTAGGQRGGGSTHRHDRQCRSRRGLGCEYRHVYRSHGPQFRGLQPDFAALPAGGGLYVDHHHRRRTELAQRDADGGFSEHQRGLRGHHRQLQRERPSHQFRQCHRRDGPAGGEREDRTGVGGGQCPRGVVRIRRRQLPESGDQRGLGRAVVGPDDPHPGASRPHGRRRGDR